MPRRGGETTKFYCSDNQGNQFENIIEKFASLKRFRDGTPQNRLELRVKKIFWYKIEIVFTSRINHISITVSDRNFTRSILKKSVIAQDAKEYRRGFD